MSHFNWTIVANGRLYRTVMKVAHRLGFCYPQPVLVATGAVWCHWCGMHGTKPVIDPERWAAEMSRKAGADHNQPEGSGND